MFLYFNTLIVSLYQKQELKDNSLFHDVKQRIRVGEGSENFMCNFYWKARLVKHKDECEGMFVKNKFHEF